MRGDFQRQLTQSNIRTLAGRPGKRTEYTDTVLQGLILSISENGSRSFRFQYRVDGKQYRYTIGSIEKTDLSGARLTAKNIYKTGANPAKEKKEARHQILSTEYPTFASVCDTFIAEQKAEWRPSVRLEWVRLINKELAPLKAVPPGLITAGNIRDLIDAIKRRPSPTTSRRTFEVVRRIFRWAIWKEIVSVSPCVAAKPFERPKARLKLANVMKPYTDEQLRGLFFWSRGTELEHLVDLIARTGVRSHDARSARKDGIRNDVWSISPQFHKNGSVSGKPHIVPLSKGALRVFKKLEEKATDWYFPAPCLRCIVCEIPGHMDPPNARTIIKTIKTKAGIVGRGLLHRLRDTIKTRMTEQLIDSRVSEHILGHLVTGIDGVYNHAELLPQRKDALAWWDQELDRILRRKK